MTFETSDGEDDLPRIEIIETGTVTGTAEQMQCTKNIHSGEITGELTIPSPRPIINDLERIRRKDGRFDIRVVEEYTPGETKEHLISDACVTGRGSHAPRLDGAPTETFYFEAEKVERIVSS